RVVGRLVVIVGGRAEVADLLVESRLRGADVPDAGKPLVEIVPLLGLFQPSIVHGETLDQVFAQDSGGPAAELGAPRGADPVADRQNGVQVVDLGAVGLAVRGSCQGFLDN